MLCLDVYPESSLGCDQWKFILGMHFSQAVAIIQTQLNKIKGVQILYSETNPLSVDLVINLPQDGIRLFFDGKLQTLKVIEIYSMKNIKLRYRNKVFNSPEVVPTIQIIEDYFGATRPGVYDIEKQLFVLNFRGLSLYFPVNTKYQTEGSNNKYDSLQFPVGTSAIVSRMTIYNGENIEDAVPPEMPPQCYYGQVYLDKACILRRHNRSIGVKLNLATASNARPKDGVRKCFERTVYLGESAQDITSAIGCPSKVYYKSDDKMQIHNPNLDRLSIDTSDYIFNYFTLGLDLLFDAHTNLLKKMIFHTNCPGHYNFNMYMRCEFNITLNETKVDAYTKWPEVLKILTPSKDPVVLNRASSSNTVNPFGSTLCYGYEDIIFEVLHNDFLGSITIFGDGKNYQIGRSEA